MLLKKESKTVRDSTSIWIQTFVDLSLCVSSAISDYKQTVKSLGTVSPAQLVAEG